MQQDRALVFAFLGSLQYRRCLVRPLLEVMQGGSFVPAVLFQPHYYDMAQVLEFGKNLPDLFPQFRVDEQSTCAAIIEHVDVIAWTQRGISWNGYRSHLDSAA